MKEGVKNLSAMQEIRYESSGIVENYEKLAVAIVAQAAKDYEQTLLALYRKPKPGKIRSELLLQKMEIENFFHSSWYETLVDADGELLLNGIRARAKEKAKDAIRRKVKAEKKRNEMPVDTANAEGSLGLSDAVKFLVGTESDGSDAEPLPGGASTMETAGEAVMS